jgi:hypothetical protein
MYHRRYVSCRSPLQQHSHRSRQGVLSGTGVRALSGAAFGGAKRTGERGEETMLRDFAIEAEIPGDSRTMFRLRVDGSVIAHGVTEAQAQLLIAEILERLAPPRSGANRRPRADPDASLV